MPLDNSKVSKDMEEILKGIPIDDEAYSNSYDMPYQTKIMLYDSKCGGCGYKRLEVGDKIFNSLPEAIEHAIFSRESITRTCEYPYDIAIINGVKVFPTLTEIVTNTCKFWCGGKK
jgi:hypothetical protein